ncbi:MAG: AAA domain-containing protein, partial [Gemmatimonadota bacterium]
AEIEADPGLNPSQRSALRRVTGSQAQFVWGPPGTGKTLLLGHAAAALARQERVLVAATTNGAVDEAAAQIASVLGRGAVEANRIVRFGADFVAGADPSLGVDAAVTRAEAVRPTTLTRAIEELAERLGVRLDADVSIGARAAAVQAAARRTGDPADDALAGRVAAAYQGAVRRAVDEADVVLTTFARLAVREELARARYDALLVDEASTATLPYVLFAAALARHRAAAFGDFQQLPAVVLSDGEHATRWMRRDIFRASGVLDSDDGLPSPKDRLCSMLREQYRMEPAIRSLVGELFYGGRLQDGRVDPDSARAPGGPAAGGIAGLVMLDTTGLDPTVSRPGGSRMNEAHLGALVQLLEALSRSGAADVAVVAPYRFQVRELRRRVRSRLGRLAPTELEIATIHRFQGREKRVVVFDTVDAPPDRSWFLDERRNHDFPRMLNVALSRSRDLLVVVGTIEGLRRTLPEEALLNRVVERVCRDGVVLDAHRPGEFARLFAGTPAGS